MSFRYTYADRLTSITEAEVSTLLATDDRWLERAIVALHERQVELEQMTRTTYVENERGYQVADALWFSKFAELIRKRREQGVPLGECLDESRKRFARRPWCRPKRPIPTICKYRRQVLDYIEVRAHQRKQEMLSN